MSEKLITSNMLPNGLDENNLHDFSSKLNERQLLWLSGYFYGLAERATNYAPAALSQQLPTVNGVQEKIPTQSVQVAAPTLTIIYGSQSGNAQKAANKTAELAQARGINTKVVDIAQYATKNLKDERALALVISTYGEGEPPAVAEDFYKFVHSARAPKLTDLQFSVLSLGDKSYIQYCQTGKDFDAQFEKLGATRLSNRIDCDVDWQDDAQIWADALSNAYLEKFSRKDAFVKNGVSSENLRSLVETSSTGTAKHFDKKNPFEAEVFEKIQLNGRGSIRETHHIELGISADLNYAPGDSLYILPENSEQLVYTILDKTGLDAEAKIMHKGATTTLQHFLKHSAELTVLSRDFLIKLSNSENAPKEKIETLLKDTAALQSFFYGRDVLDALQYFEIKPTAQQLADTLRELPARAYSIASSFMAHENEAHLTVAAVRYDAFDRKKAGVASTYLADTIKINDTVKVYTEQNSFFKLPVDTATDIIMVGPGTGVAPFRAFVEERAETNASGKNWLFFGNPNFKTDFLYQTEWLAGLKNGTLTRLDVAFSRDQAEKIYVQHRLLQKSRQVFDWLENGATFYVCGDKSRMASDVERALIDIVQKESAVSIKNATEYVKNLKKQRRYLEDVY